MSRFKNVTIQIITTNNDNIIIQKPHQIASKYCHENTQHQNQNIPTKTQTRIDEIKKHNLKKTYVYHSEHQDRAVQNTNSKVEHRNEKNPKH